MATFKDIVDILKGDINFLEEYVRYQEEKNKKLKDSLEKISKCIDEDKKVTDAAKNFIIKHDYCLDPGMDETEIDESINQVYSKVEILQSQLNNIANKFEKQFPEAHKDISQTLISDVTSLTSEQDSEA